MWRYIFIYVLITLSESEDLPYIPNYGVRCMRCICEATIGGCDLAFGCKDGYCGPFRIARIHWIDAGNITLPQDTPERNNAYEDCALNYHCAQKIILGYFYRYGRVSKDIRKVTDPCFYLICAKDNLCKTNIYKCLCLEVFTNGIFKSINTQDCNGDGVTNCDDYAMLHVNGRGICHPPVNRTERGRIWWDKYTKCDPLDRREFEFRKS